MNASDDMKREYPGRPNPYAVVVPRPTVRTRRGGIHEGSRSARIREARKMHPAFGTYGAQKIMFGDSESTDTVVIFDPSLTVAEGF